MLSAQSSVGNTVRFYLGEDKQPAPLGYFMHILWSKSDRIMIGLCERVRAALVADGFLHSHTTIRKHDIFMRVLV